MQDLAKTTSTCSPLRKQDQRPKANSCYEMISKLGNSRDRTFLEEFKVELSPTLQKRINLPALSAYTRELVEQIYGADQLGIAKMIIEFLVHQLPKLRQKIQERLSLLKYLSDALKFKPYGEVEKEILKEWRKNVIFFSINTIWSTKVQSHKFISVEQFIEVYKKQVALIANLSHFYFKQALIILDGKNVATFCFLQDDTAHKILNSLHEWKEIYEHTLLPLIRIKNMNSQYVMDMSYDPRHLNINEQYLDLSTGKVELVRTIQKIKVLAMEYRIHAKIQILKEVRATFIQEIEENRLSIVKRKKIEKFSPLEKDDIIGCMIYCIIAGKIREIQGSIQALSELLGPNNELLSRKGVDSYRADLQSAVGYLCQQGEVQLITGHKALEQEQVKLELANKSTHLELQSK